MDMKKSIFALLVLMLCAANAKSQYAVYFDADNGAVGVAYGLSSQQEAEDSAYQCCLYYDGANPKLIASTGVKRYCTMAVGKNLNGYRVIGVILAYDTEDLATEQAKYECGNFGGLWHQHRIQL